MRRYVMMAARLIGFTILVGSTAVPAKAQMHLFRMTPRVDTTQSVSERYKAEIYEKWWREIANCQGLPLPGAYKHVRWYHINALFFADAREALEADLAGRRIEWALGKSYTFEYQIFVALPYKFDEQVIKHEMLHFLLLWDGQPLSPVHPKPYYARCGMAPEYQRLLPAVGP
jgi:hypothetical protein